MIWLLIATYLLAGAVIGRLVYEFDVYAVRNPSTSDRRIETLTCCAIGLVWPMLAVASIAELVRPRSDD